MKSILIASLLLALAVPVASARIYRWVDANGKVQFSDSPPPASAQSQAELDQWGVAKKSQEKVASAGEIAQKEAIKQAELAQKRKDQALLMSFAKPEEIDFLRDRQIDAVLARVQTNKLRTQTTEGKLKRLTAQVESLNKAKKPVGSVLLADLDAAKKEMAARMEEATKLNEEIQAIKDRAESDKKRLIELRNAPKR